MKNRNSSWISPKKMMKTKLIKKLKIQTNSLSFWPSIGRGPSIERSYSAMTMTHLMRFKRSIRIWVML